MTFFNKKEEVFDIQLTPHGRYLLSIGKLKPAYYCFVDDDVVYDSNAMGFDEPSHRTNKRIVFETPKMRPSNTFGIESNHNQLQSHDVYVDSTRQDRLAKKVNAYAQTMGKSSQASEMTPSIHVAALVGEISSSSHYYSGSNDSEFPSAQTKTSHFITIPQLEMLPEYNASVHKLRYGEEFPDFFDGEVSRVFSDGTYIKIDPTNPMLHIKEFNSFNFKENFDIEVYEVDDEGRIPVYKQLKFSKEETLIKDNILLDEDYNDGKEVDSLKDYEYVGYYFDILVDDEIPQEDICKHAEIAASRDIYVDDEIECPDAATERFDIYGTRVTDIERCD